MFKERYIERLSKKAKKGMRGWPVATIAFYGPDLNRASKVAVGIIPAQNAEAEMRDWKVAEGDIRANREIFQEVFEHIERHQARSVAITAGIIGAPTRRISTTRANGVPFAISGAGETGSRGR